MSRRIAYPAIAAWGLIQAAGVAPARADLITDGVAGGALAPPGACPQTSLSLVPPGPEATAVEPMVKNPAQLLSAAPLVAAEPPTTGWQPEPLATEQAVRVIRGPEDSTARRRSASTAVPEPTTLAGAGLGGILVALLTTRRWTRRSAVATQPRR